ncbi:MAG TPA: condensation domain-containing protein, partial [Pyrinomonadaceae bacterium]|nr:condensation domain-containing protein [Pyrinomonadaceae bacterium]
MTLLAAFKVLLRSYKAGDDIVVGTDVAGRSREQTEGLIGFFVNQLVLRTELSGNPTFRETLARVRETALSAYAHQEVPFDKVVETLNPERDLSRNPLFQVMFGMNNAPRPALDLGGLKLSNVALDNETAVFDLSLYVTDMRDGLVGLLRYNADLFESGTANRLLRRYEILLGLAAERPDATLDALEEGLHEGERRQWSAREKELEGTRAQLFKSARRRVVGDAEHGAEGRSAS